MARGYIYEDDATGWRQMVESDMPGSGVTAGTYGDATHVGQFTVNAQGFVTAASSVSITGGGGGITDLVSPGSTITVTNPTGPTTDIDLPNTGVSATTYGDSTHVPQITVDAKGRLTAVSNIGIGGGVGSSDQVPLLPSIPDSSGNAYAGVASGTNLRQLLPAYTNGVDGFWYGVVRVPDNYASSGTIIIRVGANDTTGHVSRWIVGSLPVSTSATWDSALTAETAQNLTMSTTAYRPSDVTFTLSTTPVAGGDLLFYIERNGSNVADTLTVPAFLFQAIFQFTST